MYFQRVQLVKVWLSPWPYPHLGSVIDYASANFSVDQLLVQRSTKKKNSISSAPSIPFKNQRKISSCESNLTCIIIKCFMISVLLINTYLHLEDLCPHPRSCCYYVIYHLCHVLFDYHVQIEYASHENKGLPRLDPLSLKFWGGRQAEGMMTNQSIFSLLSFKTCI